MPCIGEKLEEREANKTEEVCFSQLQQIAGPVNFVRWPIALRRMMLATDIFCVYFLLFFVFLNQQLHSSRTSFSNLNRCY